MEIQKQVDLPYLATMKISLPSTHHINFTWTKGEKICNINLLFRGFVGFREVKQIKENSLTFFS